MKQVHVAVLALCFSLVSSWSAPKLHAKQLSQAVLALTLSTPVSVQASAADLSGEKIFNVQCGICHVNGGNNVFGSFKKTLSLDALKANGLASKEGVVAITTNGEGIMPRFGGKDGKEGILSVEEIDAVAEYTWSKAQEGW